MNYTNWLDKYSQVLSFRKTCMDLPNCVLTSLDKFKK